MKRGVMQAMVGRSVSRGIRLGTYARMVEVRGLSGTVSHSVDGVDPKGDVIQQKTRGSSASGTTAQSTPSPMSAAADHADAVLHYKSDTQTLANWLDIGIVSRKGRAFSADYKVLDENSMEAMIFPFLKVSTLNGEDVTLPDALVTSIEEEEEGAAVTSGVKVVCFSFKQYGFGLLRSWLEPIWGKYGQGVSASVPTLEICFVEYSFLSMAKSMFVSSIKEKVPEANHPLTALCFGGVMDFSAHLLLPNKFTGYLVVLDKNNRVRWRSCGQAEEGEVERMFKAIETLRDE